MHVEEVLFLVSINGQMIQKMRISLILQEIFQKQTFVWCILISIAEPLECSFGLQTESLLKCVDLSILVNRLNQARVEWRQEG